MYNELKTKINDFLLSEIKDNASLINLKSYEDYFETINSYINLSLFDEAEILLKHILKFWNNEKGFLFNENIKSLNNQISPVYFLEVFSNFCNKCEDITKIKKYIRNLKKCIETLEKNFDEVYLLLYHLDNNSRKVFTLNENIILLSSCDNLFDKLNEINENKLADKLFMLKGKLDLGFQRYFYNYNEEKNILLKKFIPEIDYFKIANDFEIFAAFEKYNFNQKFLKIKLKQSKIILKKETSVFKILLILINLKNNEKIMKKKIQTSQIEKTDINWKLELEKNIKYLNYFPEKIFKNLNEKQFIEKSIFINFKDDTIKFEKEKISILKINSLKSANLLLKLIGD